MARLNRKPEVQKPDDDAKARIVSAARQAFARVGFEGASTRQISAEARVAQSLVLYHFGSKATLWRVVMDDLFHSLGRQLAPLWESDLDHPAAERLMMFVRTLISICAKDPDIHRIMTIEGRQPSERLSWLVDRYLRDAYQQIRELIRSGQADGTVRKGNPTLIYYSIIAIAGTTFSLAPEIALVSGDANAVDPVAIEALIRSFLLIKKRDN